MLHLPARRHYLRVPVNQLAVLAHASARGFTTLLDAAALAPTTPINLTHTRVDAVAISFYKMFGIFGFPTGIGALVLASGIGAWLREKRPWLAGGTVEVVQAPGSVVGRAAAIDEAFEVSV
jgi:molybdenum cofactor sulfurtransferase